MTACHDRYRELEQYLQQAEEEIGLAVKELEDHNLSLVPNESIEFKNLNETLILPPQAFRSEDWPIKTNGEILEISNGNSSSVNRVCYEGNILDFGNHSTKPNSSGNSCVSRTSFASSFSPGITGKNGKTEYSPNTKRRLWSMHPSVSFPETTKDLLLLRKDTQTSDSSCKNNTISNGWTQRTVENGSDFRTLPLEGRKHRQRSNSDTSAGGYCNHLPRIQEDTNTFPRPPSGDVNLLSIWADNLVLELDKSLSKDLMNSSESFSLSSDYSLSPIKPDENFKESYFENTPSASNDIQKSDSVESNIILNSEASLKVTSRSPDSGIEQTSCNTPEMLEDCTDSAPVSRRKLKALNLDLQISGADDDLITPPPPQFKDEDQEFRSVKATQTEKYGCRRPSCLKSAEYVIEAQETTEPFCNDEKNRATLAHVIPSETIELENSPVVRTVCVINDDVVNLGNKTEERSSASVDKNDEIYPFISSQICPIFSSLPKPPKVLPNGVDKWSSLPRDGRKSPEPIYPQRSVSHSAVSTVNYVSIDELAAFMRNMNCSSYPPPSCADVSTDVKDDKENRDAVTQTTPLPLSRSSSFTWVTECDCSDWDVQNENSNSDESLIMSGCSNCKAENRNLNSSSSSLDISSDGDEDGPASPASGNSSLYLSACSGSSDSFEEATLAPANDGMTTDYMKLFDDVFASGDQQIRNSEATLRGSVLGDISEEQVTSETISMKSNISNPSLTDSNNADPQGQSASFPSTLKVSRKYRSTGSPAQPIEPTVLVINDLNLKSVSAPVLLRQKRVSSSKAPESSSSDSSPPTGTRNKDCLSSSNQVAPRSHSAKELNGMDVGVGGYVFACAISVRRIYLKFSP
ncbi:uncharacterized protein CDAR_24081 [Caerostris darwini]|uniref:Uncharacterized protein n=1 Tax=Caerostris darwini TaxID=1538125 RepID=A0AAV4QF77_9ARAC|nr:uncharacterized protein CDAR_24081 [Caerostris darwini]